MNFRFIYSTLGGISIINSLMVLLCLLYALVHEYGESNLVTIWTLCFCINLTSGAVFFFFGRGMDKNRIFRREALAVVGIGWIYCGIFSALPYFFSGVPVWDALFESYSGLTTTGATIFADIEVLPRSIVLWRSVTQWMGGLGVVILFVALLGFIGVGTKALFSRESSAVAQSDIIPKVQSLTLRYLGIYMGFTLAGIIGLLILGVSFFDATCHSLSAISTGGFSPYNDSVGHFDNHAISLWITAIMFVGGIGLPVHYLVLIQKRWGLLKSNEEVRTYFTVLLFATLIIGINLAVAQPVPGNNLFSRIVDSIFQVVSITTTTGFITTDFDLWPSLSKFVLLLLMIMGGCAGSTAGGMKVARFIVFAKSARRNLQLIIRPHLVSRLRMNRKVLDEDFIQAVIFYFAIYFVLLIIGILGFSMLEPDLEMTSTVSGVIASFNNIGPGLGKLGAVENFAFLNVASKMWLCLFMLLGRLELYAILLLFLPAFWRKF